MAKVLYADDDQFIRRAVERTLRRVDVNGTSPSIVLAADGSEAYTLFEQDPASYDLIITDNDMPFGDEGLDFLGKIQMYEYPPRLIISGRSDLNLHKKVLNLGGLGAAGKPFSDLPKVVQELLQNRGRSETLDNYFRQEYQL